VFQRLAACDVEPPTFVRRDFPGMLESIIMRALEPEPSDRYSGAYDMAEELDEFLRESGMKSGPLRIARYLDDLAVVIGGERRPELVSELEEGGDDEALDFDRGLFEGYRPAAPELAARVADWDEVAEDERAVADAIGLDVKLVKAAATAPRADSHGGGIDLASPSPSPSPSLSPSSSRSPASSLSPSPSPTPSAGWVSGSVSGSASVSGSGSGLGSVSGLPSALWLLIGLLAGAGATGLLVFVLG
jgi:hypothetical protein